MPTDIAEQIHRRRQRGIEQTTKIVNRGNHPLFSPFEVSSVSGRTYRVEIRSLKEMHNTCTCPDYRTNLIGTCKHIEAVLLHLEKKYGERLERLARKRPAGARIYLHHGKDVTVRVDLPFPEGGVLKDLLHRYFDPTGVLVGSPAQSLRGLLSEAARLPAPYARLIHVEDSVRDYLELLEDGESIAQQKAWFLDQVKRGNRSFNPLSARLYPYQEEGALHLTFGRRAMLADDMGLGKTVQAIAASALLRELRGIHSALVICPASLKHQWAREIRRFTSLSVVVVQGNLEERRQLYRESAFFKVINYEIVRRDLEELERMRPDLIILDEAQRIKNWRTKTAGAVKSLGSRYAFVLTGTPLENRLDELYSIFQFLDPRVLGPLWHFNDRFFELERRPSGAYKVLGYKNLDELRAIIAPHILRRTRDEVLVELPERVDNNFFVEMTPSQWKAYNEFKEAVAKLLAKARRRPLTPREREILLNCLVKMRIICDALALHDKAIPPHEHDKTAPKLRELRQILEDQVAGNGQKALVFSQWADMLSLAEPVVRRVGLGYVKLTGDVPSQKRGDLIERFFDDPDCRVFLSTDAGGLGLNLQAASLVVNLDLPWNPAVLEQRIARAHRHGQRHSVQVINLVAQGTIEERMLDTLAAKRSVFAGIFGTEELPSAIQFRDTGQELLQRLNEMIGRAEGVEVQLEPAAVEVPVPAPLPSLTGFAERLVGRLSGRVLLVRKAPQGDGILVVVDETPASLRPEIESLLAEYFTADVPELHLMEREGYRAFSAFFPALKSGTDEEVYRAPSMPRAAATGSREILEGPRRKARRGLELAGKRLALARLVLEGGFPEEMLRPVREAMGWGLSSLLALYTDADLTPEPPPARLVHAELVERERLPDEIAMSMSRIREITEPQELNENAPPVSRDTGEKMIAAVQRLIDFTEQELLEMGL